MLRDAGFVSMTIGIQSGSQEVLQGYNRPVPREKAIEAAHVLIDAGIDSYFDLITRVHFETETHARETFDFLCELPRGIRCIGFAHMTAFPGYGSTKKVADEGRTLSMTDKDYSYYHRLYLLARTPLPRFVKTVSRVSLFRRYPSLIEPMLPKQIPHFFLGEDDGDCLSKEILNLPHAQAVIPGGQLDRGLPSGATLQ